MKSPFPGMDPYIEAGGLWEDFHPALIGEIRSTLAQAAPERYVVRFGERSYVALVTAEGKRTHPFLPDVRISAPSAAPSSGPAATALAEPATESEPVLMRPYIQEEYRQTFVEILETRPNLRLITCIAVLSPSNKRRRSKGRKLYLRKRQGLLAGSVHLVEIDLLRRGERMPMEDTWPSSPYTLLVSRAGTFPSCRVWRAHFRNPLQAVPVPLAHPDPDITLNIQPMIDKIYAESRYSRSIDYTTPLDPPLATEDAAWLDEQLRTRQI
jgi:hypothetical protein